jgi:hypothetical protein
MLIRPASGDEHPVIVGDPQLGWALWLSTPYQFFVDHLYFYVYVIVRDLPG